jgi:hypothetical protein
MGGGTRGRIIHALEVTEDEAPDRIGLISAVSRKTDRIAFTRTPAMPHPEDRS